MQCYVSVDDINQRICTQTFHWLWVSDSIIRWMYNANVVIWNPLVYPLSSRVLIGLHPEHNRTVWLGALSQNPSRPPPLPPPTASHYSGQARPQPTAPVKTGYCNSRPITIPHVNHRPTWGVNIYFVRSVPMMPPLWIPEMSRRGHHQIPCAAFAL